MNINTFKKGDTIFYKRKMVTIHEVIFSGGSIIGYSIIQGALLNGDHPFIFVDDKNLKRTL